mmetsp:Transcript_2735/g.3028  ORF Transcript_2735/g.3028 Transcript_2735/m.3028 type:complete len:226 (+) Transcript_2735:59-736(+)
MPCFYINSVCLLLAVIAMNVVSINADCQSMYSGFIFSSGCIGADDSACPSTCTDYLTSLHESCEGEVLSTDDEGKEDLYSVNSFLALGLLASDSCEENIQNEFLTILEGSTCRTILESNSVASIFLCSDESDAESEGECSDFCKELIDEMYSTCAATDTWGEEGEEMTAQATAFSLSLFRGDTCNTYAATKTFQTPVSTTTSASIATLQLASLVSLITLSAIFFI